MRRLRDGRSVVSGDAADTASGWLAGRVKGAGCEPCTALVRTAAAAGRMWSALLTLLLLRVEYLVDDVGGRCDEQHEDANQHRGRQGQRLVLAELHSRRLLRLAVRVVLRADLHSALRRRAALHRHVGLAIVNRTRDRQQRRVHHQAEKKQMGQASHSGGRREGREAETERWGQQALSGAMRRVCEKCRRFNQIAAAGWLRGRVRVWREPQADVLQLALPGRLVRFAVLCVLLCGTLCVC